MDGSSSSAVPTVETEPPYPLRGLALLRLAHREMLDWSLIQASFCTTAGLALVAAVVFPSGVVAQLGLLDRLAYWSICGLLCWPPGHAVTAVILYRMRSLPPVLITLATAAGVLFLGVLFMAVGFGVYGWLHPEGADPAESTPLGRFFVNLAAMTFGVSALLHYVACQRVRTRVAIAAGRAEGEEEAVLAPDSPEASPLVAGSAQAFFDRLPRHVGRDVICVSVSGHYLHVVTTAGTCQILMRLSDAVLALGNLGLQVHRSHWVAHRHMLEMVRRGSRTLLQVTGGPEVRVSRGRVVEVRQAMRRNES